MSALVGGRGRGLWMVLLLATTLGGGGWAAPTAGGAAVVGQKQQHHHHHLEIGVQGNTPTLMDASTTREGKHAPLTTTKAPPKPSTTTTEMPKATEEIQAAEQVPIDKTAESGASESGTTERGTTESSTTARGTTESSTTEKSTTEISTTESTTSESSLSERRTPEKRTTERRIIASSTTESSTTESSTTTSSIIGSSSTERITTEIRTTEESTTETATIEIGRSVNKTSAPPSKEGSKKEVRVVQLLDLEHTVAPPLDSGHDGLKLTKKKQLQQQHFPPTTTMATPTIETEMERIPTTSSTTTTTATSQAPPPPATPLLPVHNGYLGPIFMGEKTFSVVHPLKKPQPANHQHVASIESQLRNGRLVEILAPTALLEQSTTHAPPAGAGAASSVLSTTVFQVPELQTSLPVSNNVVGGAELAAPPQQAAPRTESKISDIQIEVYDSTVDSIVASTNFRDSEGFYAPPQQVPLEVGTTKPSRGLLQMQMPQERFTQYVIDRADVSTQPASGGAAVGKPEPAAIEIHINVSEAFGSESEDLEFSYRQPSLVAEKQGKPGDEVLVVEIIDGGADNSSAESGGAGSSSSSSSSSSGEHINPIFTFRNSDAIAAPPPPVRPPQSVQDADELFMADLKEGGGSVALPRPPPPPPPPPPRKPSIDRDSDTIFYISNTEVKVGESLPTVVPVGEQQRKFQLENQFFPASYVMDTQQQQQSPQSPKQISEEDIILSPLSHHNTDALKIFRSSSSSSSSSSGDGAPPLDVTYVGESVIEVEQQPQGWSSTAAPPQQQQQDIIIQPAVLPDLAIGVPVIGELPPQIELKEIDYMPGELGQNGIGIYENDIQSNSIDSEPDVIESSIQYGGDLIDDGAGGGFDGVEGSYPFESPSHRQVGQGHGLSLSHLPHHQSANHLHREQLPSAEMLNATLLQRYESGSGSGSGLGSGSGSASAMAPLMASGSGRSANATALAEDPLADYDGFFNLFAVSMGLIIVILPSALLVSMYCAVKYVLSKNAGTGSGGAQGDDSEQGQDSKNEDISRNARETKMHSEKDGVFVVEVARGIDSKQLAGDQSGVTLDATELPFDNKLAPNGGHLLDKSLPPCSHEQVQIHAPPQDFVAGHPAPLHLIEEAEEHVAEDLAQQADETHSDLARTGLSQSDLSSTSSSDSNKRYSYGNQELYVIDQPGYVTSSPTAKPISISPSQNQGQEVEKPEKSEEEVGKSAEALGSSQVAEKEAEVHSEKKGETKEAVALPEKSAIPEKVTEVQLKEDKVASSNEEVSPPKEEVTLPKVEVTLPKEKVVLLEKEVAPPKEEVGPPKDAVGPSKEEVSPPKEEVSPPKEEVTLPKEVVALPKEQVTLPKEQVSPPKEQVTPPLVEVSPPKDEPFKDDAQPEKELANQVEAKPESKEELPVDARPDLVQTHFVSDKESASLVESQQLEETAHHEIEPEAEGNYDSLMSLPAPPSTEEIKELGDYTLIESNQLDSLPPPPPPPPPLLEATACSPPANGRQQMEVKPPQAIVSNGNGMGKVVTVVVTGGEEPTTLTPPASPPASPPPSQTSTQFGSGSNGLTNGMHAHTHTLPIVDVNGS